MTTQLAPSSRLLSAAAMVEQFAQVFEDCPGLESATVTFTSRPVDLIEGGHCYEFDLRVDGVVCATGVKEPDLLKEELEVSLLTSCRYQLYLRPMAGAIEGESCELTVQVERDLLPKTTDLSTVLQSFEVLCPELFDQIASDIEQPPVSASRPRAKAA